MVTVRDKCFQGECFRMSIPTKNSPWLFWMSAFTGALSLFLMGMHSGWTIPILPKLTQPGSIIPITADDRSWILSMSPLVTCLSTLVTGSIANFIGRKATLILTTVPFIANWLTVLLTRSSTGLFVSRCLGAIGCGMTSVIAFLYLCEIVTTQNRGSVMLVGAVFYDAAMIFMVVIGTYLPYNSVALISLAISAVSFVLSCFAPETVYFSLLKKKRDEAAKTLTRLRKLESEDEIKKELAVMEDFVEKCSRGSVKTLLSSAVNRRGLLIGSAMNIIYTSTGRHVIEQYGTTIFQMSGTSIDPSICSIITTSMQFVTLLVELIFQMVDRVNRRTIVLTSTLGLFTTLTAMGTYFYLHEETDVDLSAVHWLPLFFGFTFIVLHVGGLGSTKAVLSSEMISAENKAVALGLMQVVYGVSDMGVLKAFQSTVEYAGVFAALWSYAVCGLLGAIFFYFILPETRGKSFLQIYLEIEASLSKEKNKNHRPPPDVSLGVDTRI